MQELGIMEERTISHSQRLRIICLNNWNRPFTNHSCNSITLYQYSHYSPKNLNQIYYLWYINDRCEGYDKEYSCLSKTMVACMHVTITILNVMKFGLNICIVNAVVNVDDNGGKNER